MAQARITFIDLLLSSFSGDAHQRILKRGEYLCTPGDRSTEIFLIKSGAIRAYRISEDEEQTIRFGYSSSLMVALDSYFGNRPSELYFEALRKTEVLVFPKSRLKEVRELRQDFDQLYTEVLEHLVIQQMEREIDLLTQSPEKRYQRVLERSPSLFQEVPAKYIASYLRMTPETLSRLRNID